MKHKLLIIEDDPPTIDIYTTVFKKAGFLVEIADTGEEAFKTFDKMEKGKKKKPDLILLDIMLPDINGIEILENMRKRESLKEIPVFIFTNYTNGELKKLGTDLKSEKYLLKTEYMPGKIVELVKQRLGID